MSLETIIPSRLVFSTKSSFLLESSILGLKSKVLQGLNSIGFDLSILSFILLILAYFYTFLRSRNTFDSSVFSWWPVLARKVSGLGLWSIGTVLSWLDISMDSAMVRSSTNFRWILFISLIFFLAVISSPALLVCPMNPKSLTRIRNRKKGMLQQGAEASQGLPYLIA